MKPLNTWIDTKYNATSTLYELPLGTRVFHTKDPKTIDTKISVVINGGAYFEHGINVPEGTAHFLEHILAGDVNKYFKTKRQTDNFEYGDKKRPTVFANAGTSRKAMYLYSSTNSTHEERAGKRVLAMVDFPMELAEKKIEKERKIIIAERNELLKKELSPQNHFLNMLFHDSKPEYVRYVLGEIDTINEVNVEELTKFHKMHFTRDNMMISIQSSQELSPKLLKCLNTMDEAIFENHGTLETPHEKFVNTYRYGHFREPKAQGFSVDLGFFQRSYKAINYSTDVLEILTYRLLSKLIFDIMREKKGLVYSSDKYLNGDLAFDYDLRGLSFTCAPNDLVTSLNELYKIIFTGAEKFVVSKDGQRWFDSEMSKLIYPSTVNYNDSYAESRAYSTLIGYELWDHEKAIKAALKITPGDIIGYMKNSIQKEKLYVWLYSSLEEDEALRMYEKSEIHKHFGSKGL